MSLVDAPVVDVPLAVVGSMQLRLVASSDLPAGSVVDAADRPGVMFGVVAGESMVVDSCGLHVALAEALDRAHRAGLRTVSLDADVAVDDDLLERAIMSVERNRAVFFVPAA